MRILLFLIPLVLLSALGMGCSGAPAAGPTPAPAGGALPVATGPTATLVIPLPNWHLCNADGVCEFHAKLGDGLAAATPAGDDHYYTAHDNGDVALYDTYGASRTVLARGLTRPQGMVTADGRLYVSHLNDYCGQLQASTHLLRTDALGGCDFDADDLLEGITIQRALEDLAGRTGGQVVSWSIDPDTRTLGDRRVELDRLPALGPAGGPRGMVFAAGRIFLSVGDPAVMGPFNASALHRADTAGAVIHFVPGQSEDYGVFADGLGSLHSISPGPGNILFGAGPARDGGGSALMAVQQGQSRDGAAEPAALLDGYGATAVHAAGDAVYVAYATVEDGFVLDRFHYQSGERSRYYRNSPSPVVAVHEKGNKLHLFTHDGAMALLDRKHAGPISAPDHDSGGDPGSDSLGEQ